jgi:hypothetical protein
VDEATKAWDEALAVYQKDVGTWDAVVEVLAAPGASPQKTTGVAHNRMECGGRWLVMDFKAESGFSGHGVYGYDPARKRYVGLWVDNMRDFASVGEGTWDAAARTMEFRHEATVHGRPMRWREVTRPDGEDGQVMTSFFPGPDGRELEMVRITYRRRA